MRSKTVDRLSLKQTLDYKPEPLKGINIQAGDTGMSLTRLTLIGNAEIKSTISSKCNQLMDLSKSVLPYK